MRKTSLLMMKTKLRILHPLMNIKYLSVFVLEQVQISRFNATKMYISVTNGFNLATSTDLYKL